MDSKCASIVIYAITIWAVGGFGHFLLFYHEQSKNQDAFYRQCAIPPAAREDILREAIVLALFWWVWYLILFAGAIMGGVCVGLEKMQRKVSSRNKGKEKRS
jgi:hypothetical protein